MLNMDVAVSSFWQLARHWKSGEKAKLELACEGGNLHIQLSAMIGHPDHLHFPDPSPPTPPPHPSSCKRMSPSQLRRKERRREGAVSKASEKYSATKEAKSPHYEKEDFDEEAAEVSKDNKKTSAEKPVLKSNLFKCDLCNHTTSCKANLTIHINKDPKEVEHQHFEPNLSFQCHQCSFKGASDKGLKQHTRLKHRISQLDGNNSESGECESLSHENKIKEIDI